MSGNGVEAAPGFAMLNPTEWVNFARSGRRHLRHAPKYGAEIAWLALRRVVGTVRRRAARDAHRAGKAWPKWLGRDGPLCDEVAGAPLLLPAYTLGADGRGRAATLRAESDRGGRDPETYLATQRWGDCISALSASKDEAVLAARKACDWVRRMPPKTDRAWEAYSACERVVNLAVLLAARKECREGLPDGLIRGFLADSLAWIHGHLEYYGPGRTNNHILNNARALVVAGVVLGRTDALELGLAVLARMGPELFQTGGFLRERSSHYQVVVTGWLLDAVHFARGAPALSRRASEALGRVEAIARRASEATSLLLAVLGPCGTHIGDISPDMAPGLSAERMDVLYGEWMDRSGGTAAERVDDWVLVSRGRHSLVSCLLPREYPEKCTTHGHSDLGSFVWLFDGTPVLVDAGRSRYVAGETARSQVGPCGHNTLLVNGLGPLAESLLLNGRWFPKPYSAATIEAGIDVDGGLIVAHDGFSRIRGVGRHQRRVSFREKALVVVDEVEGSGRAALETLWHFPPGFSPTDTFQGVLSVAGPTVTVSAGASSDGSEPDPRWGKYVFSAAYGDEQTAAVLRLRWSVSLPCRVTTVLRVS